LKVAVTVKIKLSKRIRLTVPAPYVIRSRVMTNYLKILLLAAALAALPAAFAQGEETEEEPPAARGYLPASVYPAICIYGGAARGLSYGAADDITGRAAAVNAGGPLDDVGTVSAFGVAFDFYLLKRLATSLILTHEIAPRRKATLAYDFASFPKISRLITEPVMIEEQLEYKLQNIDYKIALKYVLFPDWPATPYAAAGVGGNSTLIELRDQVSNALIQKGLDGVLLANGSFQQFSFDWALYAGVQLNLGDSLFLVAEYARDRQFREHTFAGYKYRTNLDAFYAGAGWRFL
jgi:opacity protein-like surface antigen